MVDTHSQTHTWGQFRVAKWKPTWTPWEHAEKTYTCSNPGWATVRWLKHLLYHWKEWLIWEKFALISYHPDTKASSFTLHVLFISAHTSEAMAASQRAEHSCGPDSICTEFLQCTPQYSIRPNYRPLAGGLQWPCSGRCCSGRSNQVRYYGYPTW